MRLGEGSTPYLILSVTRDQRILGEVVRIVPPIAIRVAEVLAPDATRSHGCETPPGRVPIEHHILAGAVPVEPELRPGDRSLHKGAAEPSCPDRQKICLENLSEGGVPGMAFSDRDEETGEDLLFTIKNEAVEIDTGDEGEIRIEEPLQRVSREDDVAVKEKEVRVLRML
jgi:hypothetical protein